MIKGDLTIAEIISKYQVPRSVLSKWKKQLIDNGPEVYKKGNQPVQAYNNGNMEKLHATIGRLKVLSHLLAALAAYTIEPLKISALKLLIQ